MIAADMLIKGGKIEAREVGGRLAVITHCETPPSAEKSETSKRFCRAPPGKYGPVCSGVLSEKPYDFAETGNKAY
ncbi:MAG: hypothetical protein ACLSE6_01865 [Alphaproteobacteria bacterium]